MPNSALQSLSTELLFRVFDLAGWNHKECLQSLTLVSRTCEAVASQLLFRYIEVRMPRPNALKLNLERLERILLRRHCLSQVRSLKIIEFLSHPNQFGDDRTLEWELDDDNHYGEDEIDAETFIPLCNIMSYTAYCRATDFEEDDRAFRPLALFLQQLTGLSDLFWHCTKQLPPCVLAAVHEYLPTLRLHIQFFRLLTLDEEVIDPHELALATSPCLFSIRVIHTGRDSYGRDDYNEEAALRLAAGLSPNLSEVVMFPCHAPNSPQLVRSIRRPRPPFEGFKSPGSNLARFQSGSLTTLRIVPSAGRAVTMETFVQWSQHTDFDKLCVLDLSAGVNAGTMRWAAQRAKFHSLRELHLALVAPRNVLESDILDAAILFLNSLPCLSRLDVSGLLNQALLGTVISRHGISLQRLSLYPDKPSSAPDDSERSDVSYEYLMRLRDECSMLEELTLPILRTRSNNGEMKFYQALAGFHRLARISILLDCSNVITLTESNEVPMNASFNDFEQLPFGELAPDAVVNPVGGLRIPPYPRRGHIRDALIKLAVDGRLAQEIWNIVAGEKKTRPLESLKIIPIQGMKLGHHVQEIYCDNMVREMGRPYLVERNVRDDCDQPTIRELGQRARLARRRWTPIEEVIKDIYRTIWPEQDSSCAWYEEWKSFPLRAHYT